MLAVVGTSLASWVWHPGRERHVLTAKSPLVTVNSHVHVHSSLSFLYLVLTYPILVQQVISRVCVHLEDTRQRIIVQRKFNDSGITFNCEICIFQCSNAWIHTWDFVEKSERVLFVSVNELCVCVLKEFSMWNNIQRSQLRLGS